jgi:hypothetical protein
MTAARYRYAATGFPIGYWQFRQWAWPLICNLYRASYSLSSNKREAT